MRRPVPRHSELADEAQGIYRGEVLAIMGALADIYTDTSRILAILEGEEDDGEAQEMDS